MFLSPDTELIKKILKEEGFPAKEFDNIILHLSYQPKEKRDISYKTSAHYWGKVDSKKHFNITDAKNYLKKMIKKNSDGSLVIVALQKDYENIETALEELGYLNTEKLEPASR